jgi:predicted NUDIX family phosphoesterase
VEHVSNVLVTSQSYPATNMSTVTEVEQILVVPTELFHRLGYFQGFSAEAVEQLPQLLQPEHVSYRPRPQMEEDPGFKQLIPYVIFRFTSDDGVVHLFRYTRGKGQGEKRLHAKKSIGIGGHISSVDHEATLGMNPYEEGMRRELAEEVEINTSYKAECAGLLNDDLTEVGKVHLGIVHIFDVAEPRVRPREADMLDAGFVPLADLWAGKDDLESWSRICLEAIFPQ